MSQIKVLVVDDSAFMRKVVSDLISEDSRFCVVDTARNGREAVAKVKQLQPDVVTMDIEMPEMNGLEALKIIMEERPTPVIMLSSLTQEGAKETILALELGAIDFVGKPSGSISLDLYKVKQSIIEKLITAAGTKVHKQKLLPTPPVSPAAAPVKPPRDAFPPGRFEHLVAIGTSTGGPKALHYVLSHIPESFPAPILIVQHMPPNFTKSLAQRLNSVSRIVVVEAENGCPVESGTAYVAPGGWHMKLVKEHPGYRIRLTKDEPRNGHRPSVDCLFESLVPFKQLKRHIVIMTGMGSDGAKGMKMLRDAGAETTIAEAEQSCVVYGMPRAAVEMEGAAHSLPLQQIPQKLIDAVLKS